MEASGATPGGELRRPPLKRGEAYAGDIPFSKSRGGTDPWWTFESVAQTVRPELQQASREAAELTRQQVGRSGKVVIEATVLPNYLAASHYPDHLLAETSLVPVGSRTATGTRKRPKQDDVPNQPTKTYLLSGDRSAVAKLTQIYEREPENEGLRFDALKFTHFALSRPQSVLGDAELPESINQRYVYEAVLHPQLIRPGEIDPAATQRAREDFQQYLERLGASTDGRYARLEGDMWHIPVLIPTDARIVAEASKFAQLRVLRPMPRLRIEDPPVSGDAVAAAIPRLGVPQHEGRIAIFDGGTGTFAPDGSAWVTVHDLTDQPPAVAAFEHGSAVTSAALFGHIDNGHVRAPHTPIDHYRIWPLPSDVPMDLELPWVLDQIEAVVSKGAYRVAVITLAPSLTIDDAEPHIWTSVLDRLAMEHNVLFVVAGGNKGDLEPGLNRLLVPADLMNGLSVGSCTSLTGKVSRDDYSCVGPGRPGARTAPTGVQFGGNLDAEPFGALSSSGAVVEDEGTSLSAPVVARGCAELDALLADTSSANLLRALSAHLCERPSAKEAETVGSTPSEVGYGRFQLSYRDLMEQQPNEVMIVYGGTVKRRQRIELAVPVPDSAFEQAPTKKFEIRWTLSFFTGVEPSNPVDYSSSGIQVVFRPHVHMYMLNGPDEKTVGPFHEIDDAAVIRHMVENEGFEQAQFPRSAEQTGVAPEVELRHIHGKWEGLVRMDKRMQGKSLRRPRLDFHMLSREGGDLLKDTDDLSYALVVSVRGPKDSDLYDRTVAYASLLQPLIAEVPVLVDLGVS